MASATNCHFVYVTLSVYRHCVSVVIFPPHLGQTFCHDQPVKGHLVQIAVPSLMWLKPSVWRVMTPAVARDDFIAARSSAGLSNTTVPLLVASNFLPLGSSTPMQPGGTVMELIVQLYKGNGADFRQRHSIVS
jgi:hypothetical protein